MERRRVRQVALEVGRGRGRGGRGRRQEGSPGRPPSCRLGRAAPLGPRRRRTGTGAERVHRRRAALRGGRTRAVARPTRGRERSARSGCDGGRWRAGGRCSGGGASGVRGRAVVRLASPGPRLVRTRHSSSLSAGRPARGAGTLACSARRAERRMASSWIVGPRQRACRGRRRLRRARTPSLPRTPLWPLEARTHPSRPVGRRRRSSSVGRRRPAGGNGRVLPLFLVVAERRSNLARTPSSATSGTPSDARRPTCMPRACWMALPGQPPFLAACAATRRSVPCAASPARSA